jgi:ParB family transcriptional regulator, chromosome partitioning protein
VARKNPFANLRNDGDVREALPALDYAMKGASRSILSSIDEMAARADKLIEGETIIDLDVESVDVSFVQDRLTTDEQEFNELLEAIRERGQDSPILVRPHPSKTGRYMVVFGHRRLQVARLLGRKVRAVVKEMKDREHVIAQGQENSARANLSFIEKALFAANLARLRYDEDNATILAALAVDRTTLSKMLSVAGLPEQILHAIGPAKGVGRDRWYELKLLLEKPSSHDAALKAISENGFSTLTSDDRFNSLVLRLKAAKLTSRVRSDPRKRVWVPEDGSLAAEMTSEGKRFTLALKARGTDANAFGRYLSENLAQLYEAFRQDTTSSRNGD